MQRFLSVFDIRAQDARTNFSRVIETASASSSLTGLSLPPGAGAGAMGPDGGLTVDGVMNNGTGLSTPSMNGDHHHHHHHHRHGRRSSAAPSAAMTPVPVMTNGHGHVSAASTTGPGIAGPVHHSSAMSHGLGHRHHSHSSRDHSSRRGELAFFFVHFSVLVQSI